MNDDKLLEEYLADPALAKEYPTFEHYRTCRRLDARLGTPKRAASADARRDTTAPVGASGLVVPPPMASDPAAGWRAEHKASAALQYEFTTVETYIAYRKAESKGLVALRAPGLARLATAASRPVAVPAAVKPVAKPAAAVDAIEAEYRASPALQAEFGSFAAYRAWERNHAAGRAKITTPRVIAA